MADVLLTLDVDDRGVVRGVRNVDGELDRLEGSTKQAGDEADRLGSRFDVAMGVVAAAAIATAARAVTNFARSISQVGMDFEDEMARVAALAGATGEDLQALTDTARELGRTTRFSAVEAAQGMSFLAMAGFDANETVEAMPGLLAQASAGQVDLGTSARITSDILDGFNLEATETTRIADVLSVAFTSSNVTLESLGETMSFVAPIASGVGLSIEEVAAAAGLLGDAGIQGSRAGTALRRTIGQLNAPTGEAAQIMERLGIRTADAQGEMLPLADIIGQLEQAFEGMSGAQRTATATQLVGQQAAAGFNALLSQGGERLREYTQELETSAGAADEIAAIQEDTLAGSVRELNSALDDLRLALFETYEEDYRGAVETAIDVTRSFSRFITENREAIGAVIRVLPDLVAGLVAVTVATRGVRLAVLALNTVMRANPFGLIVTAIQVVVVALFTFRRRIAGVMAEVIDIIRNALESVRGFLDRLADVASFIPGISRSVSGLAGAFERLDGVMDGAADTLRTYANANDEVEIGLGEVDSGARDAAQSVGELSERAEGAAQSIGAAGSAAVRAGQGFAVMATEVRDVQHELESLRFDFETPMQAVERLSTALSDGAVNSIRQADLAVRDLRQSLSIAGTQEQRDAIIQLIAQFEHLRDEMRSTESGMSGVESSTGAATSAAQQFSDSLAQGLTRGQDIAEGLLGTLRQIASQLLSRGILTLLTGGTGGAGGILAGLFGGGRRRGGSVSAGRIYEINEGLGQREFFQPSSGGRVLPLGRGGEGGDKRIDVRVSGTLRGDMGELVAEIDEQRTINRL